MDITKEAFALGERVNASNARMLEEQERQHRVVYLLWKQNVDQDVLLGICGTHVRAKQEAEALGHGMSAVIRIEARVVHS